MKTLAIIIPCYNEEESLPQLFKKLEGLDIHLKKEIKTHYFFIDDGSQDKTLLLLEQNQEKLENCEILKHENNKNLGMALKTGLAKARNYDYVAFLDSDCTYEPLLILKLLAAIKNGASLALVSPYHPAGLVEGIPPWRLLLSRGLSHLYRVLLSSDLFTFTAMVRMMRSDIIDQIQSDKSDFTYVAETTIKAIQQKYIIAEIPATLKVRKFGQSKMNIFKTILAHLKLIKKIMMGEIL